MAGDFEDWLETQPTEPTFDVDAFMTERRKAKPKDDRLVTLEEFENQRRRYYGIPAGLVGYQAPKSAAVRYGLDANDPLDSVEASLRYLSDLISLYTEASLLTLGPGALAPFLKHYTETYKCLYFH